MSWIFWVWIGLALKLPIVGMCIFIYHVIKDTPDQIIGDGDGGSGVRYDQGPRKRGPEDGPKPGGRRGPRRGNVGHDEAAKEKPAPEREKADV